VGHPYGGSVAALRAGCPACIEAADWQPAVTDADAFLATRATQAAALGWSARDLFGLHPVPERPGPRYRRLSRLESAGLIWLLHGRPVVAMTATEAVIQTKSGGTVTYRKMEPRT
jgi:hypothetical protein